jgi:predicted O-methyltransferase YrrM
MVHLHHIYTEIERLERFSKKGESYANENGSFGWRNPIRQDTGRILQSLVIAANPRRILEIGTAHGLSALYLYSGLQEKNEVIFDTIEFDKTVAQDTHERFNKLNVSIKVRAGEAMEVIGLLTNPYDLIFFDAQKSHYYKQLMALIEKKLIGKGTLLLADNVIDRKEECQEFLNWFQLNQINHTIIPTECGLLVARL